MLSSARQYVGFINCADDWRIKFPLWQYLQEFQKELQGDISRLKSDFCQSDFNRLMSPCISFWILDSKLSCALPCHLELSMLYDIGVQLMIYQVIGLVYASCPPALQDVADKKKEITDDDLLALITDEVNQPVTLWSLLDLQVCWPSSSQPCPVLHCKLYMSQCCCCAQQPVRFFSAANSLLSSVVRYSQAFCSCDTELLRALSCLSLKRKEKKTLCLLALIEDKPM